MRFAICLAILAAAGPPSSTQSAFDGHVQQTKASTARDFTLSFHHQLGVEEARRRVTRRFQKLQQQYSGSGAKSTITWNGDFAAVRVSALNQTANAYVLVTDDNVEVKVHLPLLFVPLSGKIRDVLRDAATQDLQS